MSKSLIDGIYDIYLQKTGKGQEYEVPICMDDNGTIKERSPAISETRPASLRSLAILKRRSCQPTMTIARIDVRTGMA